MKIIFPELLFVFIEMLFTVKRNGDIVKARTDTNPATIVDEWECTNPKGKISD